MTDLHAVNTALEAQGFGTGLLCSLVGFRDDSRRAGVLVYLYKQGTFYPFCPTGPSSATPCSSSRSATPSGPTCPIEPEIVALDGGLGAPGL